MTTIVSKILITKEMTSKTINITLLLSSLLLSSSLLSHVCVWLVGFVITNSVYVHSSYYIIIVLRTTTASYIASYFNTVKMKTIIPQILSYIGADL